MTAEANTAKKSINRREFLNLAWLASLGFLLVDIGGMSYLFAMPRFKEGEFGGVLTIGKVGDLPAVNSAPTNLPKVKLWIANSDKGVMALYKVCTHLGCLYNWNNQEGKFICPCHGSQFQLNGTYIQGPAPRSLDRFLVQVVDSNSGDVLAETKDGDPVAMPDNPDAIVKVDTGKKFPGLPHG
jgi:cytochrome b6-f complex iron-sulfur subunit